MNRARRDGDRDGGGMGCGPWILMIALIVGFWMWSAGGTDSGTSSGSTWRSSERPTSDRQSTTQSRRFDAVLDDLAENCQESKSQLRRMINRAVEMKREEGVATGPVDVAEGLRTAIRGIRPGECVDELSALLVLMNHQ